MSNKVPLPLAALFAACICSQGIQPVSAQLPPTPRDIAVTCHQDLLACYQSLAKTPEQEVEYKWLIQQQPGDAVLHYNYACFLQHAGKTALAAGEYKKAATLQPSNVDFVGAYGQMALFLHQNMEAYNFLGRAMQMPGGEKYKNAFENVKVMIQNQQQQQMINKMNASKGGGGATLGGKKHSDDDDD